MKQITKLKCAAIHQWCKIEEKSIEYTTQVIQDMVKVENETAINYLMLSDAEQLNLEKEVNDLLEIVIQLENTKL